MKRFLISLSMLLTLSACITVNPFENNRAPTIDNEAFSLGKTKITPASRVGHIPVNTAILKGTTEEAAQCIYQQMQSTFKIPADFISIEQFPNQLRTISLINPATNTAGVSIDLKPMQEYSSHASLYDNGMSLSNAWKNILKKCE